MATLEEIYERALSDEGERTAFVTSAETLEGLTAFLAERGCDATPEQVASFLKEKQAAQGEISDAELEAVSGGCNGAEAFDSVITFGVGCAVEAIYSAATSGSKGIGGRILCAEPLY